MLDRFNRKIDYLRISVTDRCNLRCRYCIPEKKNLLFSQHGCILSYEQIEAFAKTAVRLGILKIRLTGGEPLLRRDVEFLVKKLADIKGVNELCMTTNGSRLSRMADKLKQNGLHRVNISLDTTDPEKYRQITGGGDIRKVFAGIDAALSADLMPIKINMVILADTSEDDIEKMSNFCKQGGLQLQKILHFNLYDRKDSLNLMRTDRPPACLSCNKLRLMADGFIKPCLFSEDEIRVDFDDIEGSILKSVSMKPANGISCKKRFMYEIGG